MLNNNQHNDFEKLIAVGRVVNAHGLKGELKVYPLSNIEDRFDLLETVVIEMPDGRLIKSEVEYSNPLGEYEIMKLKDTADRDTAEKFKGAYINIPIEDIAELDEDSFYIFELEGLDVFTPDGKLLGIVARIDEYPANNVIVVKNESIEIMIPAVREYVKEINIAEKKIIAVSPDISNSE